MAIGAQEINFELSGGAANTDPNLSFKDIISGTSIHEFQSTLTSNQPPDRSLFVDTSRIGDGDDDHNDKFVLFVGGAANLSAHRIIDFRDSDGLFTLEGRTAAAALSGDFYRVFELNSLYHQLSAAQCAIGHLDYRLVYTINNSANVASAVSLYFLRLLPAIGWSTTEFECMARANPNLPEGSSQADETVKATETAPQAFTQPEAFDDIDRQPRAGSTKDLPAGQFRGVYLRRTVPANSRRNPYVVALLVHEMTDDASSQIKTGLLIPYGQLGFTPEITVSPDRGPTLTEGQVNQPYDSAIYVGGGARYTALVKAQETGLVVPELEVGWKETGDGTLFVPDTPLTDDDGLASVTYHAPLPGVLAQETIAFAVEQNPTVDEATLNDVATIEYTNTVAAGNDRILLVAVAVASDVEDDDSLGTYGAISVTVNGVEMGVVGQAAIGTLRAGLFYLLSPVVGANAIKVTMEGVVECAGSSSFSATGVDLANPFDGFRKVLIEDDTTSTTLTQTFTTLTDNAALLQLAVPGYPFTVLGGTPGGGQTDRTSMPIGFSPIPAFGRVSTKSAPTAGAQTMSRSALNQPRDGVSIVTALRPALASATVTARV